MKSKLAGHLSLQDMIYKTIESTRMKLAAAEEKIETEETPEVEEKTASVTLSKHEEIEKLATALEAVAEKFASDAVFVGSEGTNSAGSLPVMQPVKGTQKYSKDKAKLQPPSSEGTQSSSDSAGKTQMPNDAKKGPYLKQPYPAKGVLKSAAAEKTAAQTVLERIQAASGKTAPAVEEKQEKAEEKTPAPEAEKKADAVEYIVNKIAEYHGGGMTLDSAAGKGPKPPSGEYNSDRNLVQSNAAATNATKADAKKNEKKLLKQVLTEPAMSKATDSKVHENLRNATKGGVKIAAMKTFLGKVAGEGCSCDGAGSCRYCKMKSAMTKQSSPSNKK